MTPAFKKRVEKAAKKAGWEGRSPCQVANMIGPSWQWRTFENGGIYTWYCHKDQCYLLAARLLSVPLGKRPGRKESR